MRIKYLVLILLISSTKMLASGNINPTLGMPLNSLSLQEFDKDVKHYKLHNSQIENRGIFKKLKSKIQHFFNKMFSLVSGNYRPNKTLGITSLCLFLLTCVNYIILEKNQPEDLESVIGYLVGVFTFYFLVFLTSVFTIYWIVQSIIVRRRAKKSRESSPSDKKDQKQILL